MTPPGPYTWPDDEDSFFDSAIPIPVPTSNGSLLPSGLDSLPYHPCSSMSTVVSQECYNSTNAKDFYTPFPAPTSSIDSNGFVDSLCSMSGQIAPRTEDGSDHIFTKEPETINVPRTEDDIHWRSSPPIYISYAGNPFIQGTRDILQAPCDATSADLQFSDFDINQQEVGFTTFNSMVPVSGIHGQPYLVGNTRADGRKAAQCRPYTPVHSVDQLITSVNPLYICQWKAANGTLCGECITVHGLSEHLSKHGVKNQTRDHPTKCRWDGCKKHMNRESIVRHIREVHLYKKRPSKRTKSVLNTPTYSLDL